MENPKESVKCPEGQVFDPKTKKCKKDCAKDQIRTEKGRCRKCVKGTVIDPATKTCIPIVKECPVGHIRDPKTKRCKKCPDGTVAYHNNCVKPRVRIVLEPKTEQDVDLVLPENYVPVHSKAEKYIHFGKKKDIVRWSGKAIREVVFLHYLTHKYGSKCISVAKNAHLSLVIDLRKEKTPLASYYIISPDEQ